MSSPKRVLIIGGGPVGVVTVHILHMMAPAGAFAVRMIRSEASLVNRCAVPYGLDKDDEEAKNWIVPDEFVTNFGCELVVDTVESIDREAKCVRTAKGASYEYDFLVLGLGSKPIVPPFDGATSRNVLTVRNTEDMHALRAAAAASKKAVVVGGGYIGMEIAESLAAMKLEVTVVEMLPHILLATSEDEFAEEVEAAVAKTSVRVLTGRKVVELKHKDGLVHGVVLDGGDVVDTDFVVMSVGVRGETKLAADAGLEVTPYGVVVNEKMQTADPAIFAAGDCAQKMHFVTGKPTRGELGTTAIFMAKVLAMNLLGMPNVAFPGVINANVSTGFGYSFGSAGLIEKAAVAEGIEVVTGTSEVLDKYPMMAGKGTIKMKLVFDKKTMRLIGGSVLQTNKTAAPFVNLISLAIQKQATLQDMMGLQYCTHPELAVRPSEDAFVGAARAAMMKMMPHQSARRVHSG